MIENINTWSEVWLNVFLDIIVQNTLFLLVLLFILHLIRDCSARFKYIVALLGAIKLLLPPFLPSHAAGIHWHIIAQRIGWTDLSSMQTIATRPSPSGILFLTWSSTAVIFFLISLAATVRLKRQLVDAAWIDRVFIEDHSLDIYSSAAVRVPMILGWRKKIYVPITWPLLDTTLQDALLRHELAHIKRRDILFTALQMLTKMIYFFHPLVWLLNERINEYREMTCDDEAVDGSRVTPLLYSRYLLLAAENLLHTDWSLITASAVIRKRNKLYQRVTYQIRSDRAVKSNHARSRLIIGFTLLLIGLFSWYSDGEKAPHNQSLSTLAAELCQIEGTVTNIDNKHPLTELQVWVEKNAKTKTDKNGRYTISRLPEGDRTLFTRFRKNGHQLQLKLFKTFNAMIVEMQMNAKSPHHASTILTLDAIDMN